MTDSCRHCGLPPDDHHEYESAARPPGCLCDPGTWDRDIEIPPICTAYDGPVRGYCVHCEHDEACHAKERTDG